MNYIDRSTEGVWSGYILKFGDPVPGVPGLTFNRSCTYETSRLYTQGPVTLISGSTPVGQIAHIKKDDIGLHIVMPLDNEVLPEALVPLLDRLIWVYSVDTARILVTYREDDPTSSTKSPALALYPLLQVQYSIGEPQNAVQTSGAVIERRPKNKGKRS